jgi:hypothetical protein
MENTETVKETQQWKGNFAELAEESNKESSKKNVIEAPIFIIFAEYLGYVSRFNQLAVEWCDGKIPETYIQKIMIMEAKSIFRQMQKDYTLPTIKYWYNTYYPVILEEFADKLAKTLESNEN